MTPDRGVAAPLVAVVVGGPCRGGAPPGTRGPPPRSRTPSARSRAPAPAGPTTRAAAIRRGVATRRPRSPTTRSGRRTSAPSCRPSPAARSAAPSWVAGSTPTGGGRAGSTPLWTTASRPACSWRPTTVWCGCATRTDGVASRTPAVTTAPTTAPGRRAVPGPPSRRRRPARPRPVEEHDVGEHRRAVGPQVQGGRRTGRPRGRRPGQGAVEQADHHHGRRAASPRSSSPVRPGPAAAPAGGAPRSSSRRRPSAGRGTGPTRPAPRRRPATPVRRATAAPASGRRPVRARPSSSRPAARRPARRAPAGPRSPV